MAKKREIWQAGVVFAIELKDRSYAVGQILQGGKDSVTCAFFDLRFEAKPDRVIGLSKNHVIAVLKVTTNHFDRGTWDPVGTLPIVVPRENWPNERYAASGYVGAKSYTSPIAQTLMNAYFGLEPWDQYKDPSYLDSLLSSGRSRPVGVILERRAEHKARSRRA
jgi:hypothetical protein